MLTKCQKHSSCPSVSGYQIFEWPFYNDVKFQIVLTNLEYLYTREMMQFLVHCDGHRRDDVVVGAPFYHQSGVGGAIYIYMNGPEVMFSVKCLLSF